MPKTFIVDDEYHETRLDKWFKQKVISLPHSLIERILRQNKIKINKKKVKSSYRLQSGDLVEIYDISKFKLKDKRLRKPNTGMIDIALKEWKIDKKKST